MSPGHPLGVVGQRLTAIRPPARSPTAPPMPALLFDMDGVLVDVSRSYRRVIEETVLALTGVAVRPGEVQALKDAGGYNDDWKTTHALVQARGHDAPFEAVKAAFQQRYRGEGWDGRICDETPLVATDVLERLARRHALALVTGRPEDEARFTLDRMGWTALLPVVVALEQCEGRGKPDPFPLLEALRRLDETPAAAAYVGDLGDDMRAAKAAGMRAVGHVPPYLPPSHADVLRAAGADVVISRMADLGAAVG